MMEVLIAEDDPGTRRILEATLTKCGYNVRSHGDGNSAFEEMERKDSPRLAILDWILPGMDGVEICRRLRQGEHSSPPYLILLTSLDHRKDVIAGLDAGADDYMTKPFDSDELHARIRVGERVIELQAALAQRDKLLGVVEMAGAVCHEMNQPLQVASIMTEHLLMDFPEPPELKADIETLRRQVKRMGEITQRIMTITRYETTDYLDGTIIDINQGSSHGSRPLNKQWNQER